MMDKCAAMLGYTEDELIDNFSRHIENTAGKLRRLTREVT